MIDFPPILDFTRHPNISAIIAAAERRTDCVGFTTLLRATAAGRIGLVAILKYRAVWTPRSLKSTGPTIVLIGDDFGESRDPDEWRCAISAIAWAKCAVIHGTGAKISHYETAIISAETTGRCLIVETDSAHAGAWSAAIALRSIPILTIVPPPGTGPHPRWLGDFQR